MKNYLYVISLKTCPYCLNTKRILEEFQIRNKNIVIKDDEKNDYKNEEISTFPQIYYVKNDLNRKDQNSTFLRIGSKIFGPRG